MNKLLTFLFIPLFACAQYTGYGDYGGYTTNNTYTAEASALFARMTTQPDATRKTLINNLIVGLKNAGIWQKLDVFTVYAAHSEQASLLNWVSTSFNAVKNGSPTFTIDKGWAGNGSDGWLDISYVPSDDAINYTQNSASCFIYVRSSADENISDVWSDDGNSALQLRTLYASEWLGGTINVRAFKTYKQTENIGLGLYGINRISAASSSMLRNGISVTSNSDSSVGLPANNVNIMKYKSSYTTKQYACFSIGGGLTSEQSLTLFNLIETYLDAIGAGVVN